MFYCQRYRGLTVVPKSGFMLLAEEDIQEEDQKFYMGPVQATTGLGAGKVPVTPFLQLNDDIWGINDFSNKILQGLVPLGSLA